MSEAITELPKYQSHKKVWALKIKEIEEDVHNNGYYLVPEEEGYIKVAITKEWMVRFKPEIGGYYIVYEDGYSSYSPAKAFEEGYTKI